MQLDDIRRHLEVGFEHALCVHVERSSAFPGYVRTVCILPENKVSIAFEVYGMDEGGAYYDGTYNSLELLVADLERYLGQSVEKWENEYSEYPERDSSTDLERGHANLQNAIGKGLVPLPSGAAYKLQPDGFWEQFETPR